MLSDVLGTIDESTRTLLDLLQGNHLVKGNTVMEDSRSEIEVNPVYFENKEKYVDT